MMENLLLVLILVYVFAVGYLIVSKLGKFIHDYPRAFPGHRGVIVPPPATWQTDWEDDKTCKTCYNDCTNCKEHEHHEERHP